MGTTRARGIPASSLPRNPRVFKLLRNGIEVASKPMPSVPNRGANHRSWFNIALRKHGSTVEFWVADQQELTFTDPRPLDGGVPAIWTSNNGICIARARLHFATPPVPRSDPLVVIDSPWYPEWGNVGRPLTLQFAQAAASSGRSLTLRAEAAAVPTGETTPPAVQGNTVTFTPGVAGEHWYRVTAEDGITTSAPFHLTLPVFTPALGRDDSHALALYRFDEGTGTTIHDGSTRQPALDLKILDKAQARWVPGQGLNIGNNGTAPIMSPHSAAKLMAIARTRACTLELWVSADTIYPNNGTLGNWIGTFVAWENSKTERNFAVALYSESLILAPGGALLESGDERMYSGGFRIGLQHLVFTWDGTTTRFYLNGTKISKKTTPGTLSAGKMTPRCCWATRRKAITILPAPTTCWPSMIAASPRSKSSDTTWPDRRRGRGHEYTGASRRTHAPHRIPI